MKNFLLILGIVICIVGGIWGGLYWHSVDDVYFEGKEVFQTQEDYVAFKIEMGKDNVAIQEIQTLSSEPPIVVMFEVLVSHNYMFPYGEKKGTTEVWILMVFLAIPIALMVCSLFPETED